MQESRQISALERGPSRGRWLGAAGLPLALLLLLACPQPSGESPKPGGLVPGARCTSSTECQGEFVCDQTRQICVCADSGACPGETVCHPHTGRCVPERPGCERDGDCPPGRYCDPEARACRVGAGYCEPCERDGECGEAGARCLEGGFCGRACVQDRDCGERARCLGGQCTPGLRCSEIDGRRTGRCVDPCRSDADCAGEGERCEVAIGLCRPAIGCDALIPCVPDSLLPCERDADCLHTADQVCELGQCVARRSGCAFDQACDPVTLACVPSCRENVDCLPGRTCLSGACHPAFRCQRDQHHQCPRGMVCACPKGMSCSTPGEGECKPECQTNEDCPLRSVCVDSFGRKICEPGCESARDCGPEEICSEIGTCVRESLACKFTELCPFCSRCVEGSCVPTSGHCAKCDDDSTCAPSGVCFEGHCVMACGAGCPSGYGCQKIVTAEAEFEGCLPLDGNCDCDKRCL